VKAIGEGRSIPTAKGKLQFVPTKAFSQIAGDEVVTLTIGRVSAQSTNTSVTLGERLFLKCYRRIRSGMNPELEVGRFLTEVAHFPHCVPLAGYVEYAPAEGEGAAVALLQALVPNQGDGWSYTLAYLERHLEGRGTGAEPEAEAAEAHGSYLALIQILATRTAELHRALAMPSGDPAFQPEPFTAQDLEEWKQRVRQEAEETLGMLERRAAELSEKARERVRAVLGQRGKLFARIDACPAPKSPTQKTRHHGDYHLGQVLLANNDFVIIDFEGEPSRPLADGRKKHTPLRDVAGMLRSFSYAKWSALARGDGKQGTLDKWEASTRSAFLTAYAAASKKALDDERGLLELAELEKVLYELRYELGNRPAWVQVPLDGLATMLAKD
jgi:maltose alpha-D-glucosyltransferase/alpha-amylase